MGKAIARSADMAADAQRLADAAMARGDRGEALQLLIALADGHEVGPDVWIKLAALYRADGNLAAALSAIEAALALAPLDPTALLVRATLLDGLGRINEAGEAYDFALAQRQGDEIAAGPMAAALDRARLVRDNYRRGLEATMAGAVATSEANLVEAERRRLDRFISNTTRRTRAYPQVPTHFNYPGLPVDEFHDPALFPWLAEVEAATDSIAAELQVLLAGADLFEPYVDYAEGRPLAQWVDLHRSRRWSAIHLFKAGRATEAAASCPRTMALLATLPQPVLLDRSPAAMFSALAPHTRIPPHTGVGNVRLVCHLPLIVPPGCVFRVGDERREWVRGKAWVFDDTIEHEAWNDSDDDRIILIFDVWHPALSAAERSAIATVFGALDASYGDTGL